MIMLSEIHYGQTKAEICAKLNINVKIKEYFFAA